MSRKKGKHRKRTSKHIPAKGVLRRHADILWSRAVRNDWGWKCAVCGATNELNAHHLIPRQCETLRYSLRNGIALCASCHQFDAELSPHQNAAGWMLWLATSDKPDVKQLNKWYTATVIDSDHKTFNGTTNASYFCDLIRGFEQYVEPDEYEKIVGVKFSRWLTENT